ncbi:UNVERIFIED_CONTAM: hypothetical protein Sangu_0699200, partial [Sesamum angustifolium]
ASSYDYDVSGLSERFFDVVQAVDQPLYSGCDQSQLAAVARLVNIKAEHNMSERCYDQVSQWASDLLPRDHTLPSNYYNTKKMIRDLGLPVEKIHACRNGCMLYWKDDIDMEYCKFCGDPRYKPTRDRNPRRKKSPYAVLRYLPLTPRLQRLYASPATAEHMTWHASHVTEEDSMCHPSDAEAWRHFDRTHPNFALEPRNIRLGLHRWICSPRAVWSNLLMLASYNYTIQSSTRNVYEVRIHVPVDGVRTHDHATNQAFMMRAALMWTVNDLPAYGMASGGVLGIMGCPICMDDTSAFYLQHGRKRATLTAIDVSPTRSSVPEKQESLHKKSSGKKYCKA